MNKYIALLSVAVGIGVFAGAVNIATPCPVLRTTEDSAIRAEYDAPIASFLGTVPKGKGAAHTPTAHASRTVNRASEAGRASYARDSASDSAESTGPTFGQFSTRTAMNYQTVSHHSRTPNPRQVVGKITVNGYVSK